MMSKLTIVALISILYLHQMLAMPAPDVEDRAYERPVSSFFLDLV